MSDNVHTNPVSSDLLELLRSDPQKGLTVLYRQFKAEYLNFIRHYGGERQMHLDSYHDAVLGFYDVFIEGKYDPDKAGIKTLLFTIGKYRLLTQLEKNKRSVALGEREQLLPAEIAETVESSERVELARAVLGQLGEKCIQIIELFYYRRLTVAEIVIELGYKNENVMKAHKSRCMKSLREKVKARSRDL